MTNTNVTSTTPLARLAASRQALARQMTPHDGPTNPHYSSSQSKHEAAPDSTRHGTNNATWQIAKQAAFGWWQHHPAHLALDAGRPYLDTYARDKPLRLLGIAAGVGALAVVVKPWRLVSATGLAVTAWKSTNLPATLLTFITSGASDSKTASQANQTKEK